VTARGVLGSVLKVVVVCYAIALLGFIWLTKDLTFATLTHDPLFASYSIAVVVYVLGRFVLALFYRPTPDVSHRPTVSVVIPAFNEQEGIVGTIHRASRSTTPPSSSRSSW
jgi:hyaluronan synthase